MTIQRSTGPVGRLGRGFAADHLRAILIAWASSPSSSARSLRGRDGALRRRLAGERLASRCRPATLDRAQLRRAVELRADRRRALAGADDLRDPRSARRSRGVERVLAADAASRRSRRRGRARSSRATATPPRDGRRERRPDGDGRRRRRAQAASSSARAPRRRRLADRRLRHVVATSTRPTASAMMKSELLSWPVTLAILVLAFGSLVAAGLPLLLTILGPRRLRRPAVPAAHGLRHLDLGDELRADVRARARASTTRCSSSRASAARCFGSRLPAARRRRRRRWTPPARPCSSPASPCSSRSRRVMLVPSPAFRSMALGIMLAVAFVLAATLTLLPAVLAKLGPEDRRARRCRWAHSRRAPLAALRRAGASGCGAQPLAVRAGRDARPASLLALPVLGLRTGMPSIKVVPPGDGSREGYTQVQQAFGPGAPGTLQIVAPRARRRARPRRRRGDPGIARVLAAAAGRRRPRAGPGGPDADPSSTATGAHDRPPARRRCPPARSSAAPPPRTTTSRRALAAQDAARDRRRAGARLPAAARRAAGAADRRARRRSPTCSPPAPPSASRG